MRTDHDNRERGVSMRKEIQETCRFDLCCGGNHGRVRVGHVGDVVLDESGKICRLGG